MYLLQNVKGKCRKLLLNKYIHSFWATNGTIKLKTIENGRVCAVTHRNDLENLFPVGLFNNYVTLRGWVSLSVFRDVV